MSPSSADPAPGAFQVNVATPGPQQPAQHAPAVITDPQAMRALAHEARLEALEELYSSPAPRTATQLAQQCGISPAAMSYHLRLLEKYGFIERAAASDDGRERLWQAVGRGGVVVRPESPESSVVNFRYMLVDQQMSRQRRRIFAELDRRASQSEEAEQSRIPVLTSGTVFLTASQRDDFISRMRNLIDEFEELSTERETTSEAQRLYYLVSTIPETAPQEQSETPVQN